MPKQIFGAESVVATLNRAFNDQSPSNATFNNQVAAAGTTADSQMAFAKQFGSGYAGMTADALSTKLLGNLGVLPNAALQTALKDYITAAGVSNVGIIALQLGDILSGLENATGDQAGFAAAALAWNNEVTASYNYSANPANTGPGPIGNDDTAVTGVTISLGSAVDDFISPAAAEAKYKTTANNDTIVGAGNLSAGDTIDAGGGTDTMNVTMTGTAGPAATIKNLEIINVTAGTDVVVGTGADTFNATNITGLQQLWGKGSTATTGADGLVFTNVDKSTVVGLKSTSGTGGTGALEVIVGYKSASGLADAATVALGGTVAGTKVTADGIETLTVNSITALNALTIVGTTGGNTLETVNVTGDKGVALTLTDAEIVKTLKAVDASAATGSVTVTATAALTQTAVSIKTGTGADTVDIAGAATKVTIDTGAGNDTVNLDAVKAHAITLGAGNDTVAVVGTTASGLKATTAATVANGAVTVTDFVSGSDKVALTLTGGKALLTLTGTEQSTVSSQADLKAAAGQAAALAGAAGTTVGDAVAFSFGGDSYVFVDVATAGAINDTDVLIKLTGVASLASGDVYVA